MIMTADLMVGRSVLVVDTNRAWNTEEHVVLRVGHGSSHELFSHSLLAPSPPLFRGDRNRTFISG